MQLEFLERGGLATVWSTLLDMDDISGSSVPLLYYREHASHAASFQVSHEPGISVVSGVVNTRVFKTRDENLNIPLVCWGSCYLWEISLH